jgi:hypothetical protein
MENENLHINIEEELIFPEESVVRFPCTVGITGEIFKTGGIKISNGNIYAQDEFE